MTHPDLNPAALEAAAKAYADYAHKRAPYPIIAREALKYAIQAYLAAINNPTGHSPSDHIAASGIMITDLIGGGDKMIRDAAREALGKTDNT